MTSRKAPTRPVEASCSVVSGGHYAVADVEAHAAYIKVHGMHGSGGAVGSVLEALCSQKKAREVVYPTATASPPSIPE